jgi:hypothetical protein
MQLVLNLKIQSELYHFNRSYRGDSEIGSENK